MSKSEKENRRIGRGAEAGSESDAPIKLELSGLHKSFGSKRKPLPVIGGVSLQVHEGEFVSLIGPSGSGKSTLFHLIGGLLQPEQGEIRLDGRVINGERGHIGYMPQQPALFPWRTIEDNVVLDHEVNGIPRRETLDEARRWMERAGLAGFEQAYPHMLSGGMQQRAAFVRALLSPHGLMCLDEPFSALDAFTRSEMQTWLLDIWEETRRSVLFVTHHIEEALLLSDTIYVLSGRPSAVLRRIEVPFPRPRREEIAESPEFLALRRELTGLMKEEQRKTRSSDISGIL
ncbi:ABC transporter ATP-binding protein [Saccharibacillus kuerlensis]|uniref:ABC transporter ATP-binding protein n=1 Tax=Saccharibacillus kuerlensis TaxID=459527 RepID=A0ABQ2L2G5_9BACL|nr:ABC transporter ATP-binding protein [Saccharibacillus kuerlensis]GGO00284.1 ABC transporter ATP-binding protein [Saccharibacillus kuerlensis]